MPALQKHQLPDATVPAKEGEEVTRVELIKQMLREHPERAFATIASDSGVSRERVRQIAATIGDNGRNRIKIRAEKRAANEPPPFFRLAARRWLNEIGCGYCATCFQAKSSPEMAKPSSPGRFPVRCKQCCSDWRLQYIKTEKGRAYMERYQQTEKYKAYRRDYEELRRQGLRPYGKMEVSQ